MIEGMMLICLHLNSMYSHCNSSKIYSTSGLVLSLQWHPFIHDAHDLTS